MPSMRLRPVAFGRSIWLDGAVRIRPALPQRSCRNLRSLPIVIRWSSWTPFQSSLQALMRTPRQRLRSLCFGHSRRDRSRSGGAVCSCSALAPLAIEGDGRVRQMVFSQGREDAHSSRKIAVDCGLVFSSIGRRAAPIGGIPYDEVRGVHANIGGRLAADGCALPGLYVCGWGKRGPQGTMARTGHAALKPWRTSLPICRSSMRRRVIPIACSQRSLSRDMSTIRPGSVSTRKRLPAAGRRGSLGRSSSPLTRCLRQPAERWHVEP